METIHGNRKTNAYLKVPFLQMLVKNVIALDFFKKKEMNLNRFNDFFL